MRGLVVFAAIVAVSAAAAEEGVTGVSPDEIVWRANPLPGNKTAVLLGGVDKPGLYAFRAKLDKGALIPPHTHPDTRMITVLSGELFAGSGAKFDETSGRLYPAGSFFVVPAGVAHFSWAKNGEVVYQEQGFGPTPTTFFKQ